ncbi:unnamed protein product [Heligmosomoides polygyrus]|uniref:Uncharacterized protein n=1 Tax=Heligmosomoides polygyrus TaxID=6339 RepID=A0A183GA37_HELPZ|nr:unnamed protein product [Heligmosomoides polygyrus]
MAYTAAKNGEKTNPKYKRGFLVKKRPKDIVDVAGQRLRGEHGGDVDHAHVRADPYGRLASWIQANARPYLPVRHPRSTLDVHVSAGLYQIVDLLLLRKGGNGTAGPANSCEFVEPSVGPNRTDLLVRRIEGITDG